MGRKLSPALKTVIQDLVLQGQSTVKISRILTNTYNFYVSRQGIRYFVKNYMREKQQKPVRSKFKNIHKQSMDLWLSKNKDLTALNLKSLFIEHYSIDFSLSTIKFHRRALQWTMKRKRYCQLISHKNKLFRVDWCLRRLSDRDTFKDVIFVDESNIELSSAGRLSFYQMGSSLEMIPSRAAKPKHSYTVSTVISPNIARPLTLRTSQSDYATFNQMKSFLIFNIRLPLERGKQQKVFTLSFHC